MVNEKRSLENGGRGRQIAFGLAFAFAAYYLATILGWFGIRFGPMNPSVSIFWKSVAVLSIFGYVWFYEKRSLSSIGIAWPNENQITWAFYLWGATMAWYWVASTLVPPTKNQGLDQITSMNPLLVLGIVIAAAIGEEVFYRGYLIERLRELTGYLWVGALVSFAIFLVPHIQFFGLSWLLYHSMGTVMLYVLYLWKRNLVAVMFLHLLVNLPIMIPTLLIYFSSEQEVAFLDNHCNLCNTVEY